MASTCTAWGWLAVSKACCGATGTAGGGRPMTLGRMAPRMSSGPGFAGASPSGSPFISLRHPPQCHRQDAMVVEQRCTTAVSRLRPAGCSAQRHKGGGRRPEDSRGAECPASMSPSSKHPERNQSRSRAPRQPEPVTVHPERRGKQYSRHPVVPVPQVALPLALHRFGLRTAPRGSPAMG